MARAAELAGLVSARLCHDLISPIGAISNGVELMSLSQPSSSESQLITDSVETAKNRVKFFRLAFGVAPLEGRVELDELSRVAPFQLNHRIAITWQAETKDLPRNEAQGILLALMCLEKCLPRGGDILVRVGTAWADLSARGDKVEGDGAGWKAFDGADVSHSDVQFGYLAALREDGLLALDHSDAADSVTLKITFTP